MGKTDSIAICNFIEKHYDYVSQEDWFELCDLLLEIVVRDANKNGYSAQLVKEFPEFFNVKG